MAHLINYFVYTKKMKLFFNSTSSILFVVKCLSSFTLPLTQSLFVIKLYFPISDSHNLTCYGTKALDIEPSEWLLYILSKFGFIFVLISEKRL